MSLPRENLEELLSSYIDDAVSEEERRQVERLLATDPLAQSLIDDLRALQRETRAAMRCPTTLDTDFCDQVVAAAINAKNKANPAQDLASGPDAASPILSDFTAASPSVSTFPKWVILVGTAGLFAATAFIFINKWFPLDGPDKHSAITLSSPKPASQSDLAKSPPASTGLASEKKSSQATALALTGIADLEGLSSVDNIVSVETGTQTRVPLQVVLILDVAQSQKGKVDQVVLKTLRKRCNVSIQNQPIDNRLVGLLHKAKLIEPLGTSTTNQANIVTVLYTEATGKQLDRMIVTLHEDSAEVEQINWALAMDPPLVVAVNKLRERVLTAAPQDNQGTQAWSLNTGADRQYIVPSRGPYFSPLPRGSHKENHSSYLGNQDADSIRHLILFVR